MNLPISTYNTQEELCEAYDENNLWPSLGRVNSYKDDFVATAIERLKSIVPESRLAGLSFEETAKLALLVENELLLVDRTDINLKSITDKLIEKTIKVFFQLLSLNFDFEVCSVKNKAFTVVDENGILLWKRFEPKLHLDFLIDEMTRLEKEQCPANKHLKFIIDVPLIPRQQLASSFSVVQKYGCNIDYIVQSGARFKKKGLNSFFEVWS